MRLPGLQGDKVDVMQAQELPTPPVRRWSICGLSARIRAPGLLGIRSIALLNEDGWRPDSSAGEGQCFVP